MKNRKNRYQRIAGALSLMAALLTGCLFRCCPVSAMELESLKTQKMELIVLDDDTGEELDGAAFVLEKKTDGAFEEIMEFQVPETGYDLGELPEGEYRLTEMEAPVHYLANDEVIEFEVTEDGTELTNQPDYGMITDEADGYALITVWNIETYSVKMWRTGGIGTEPYTYGGLFLAAAAVCGLIRQHRSRE